MAQCVIISIVNGVEVLTPTYESPCMSMMVVEPSEFAMLTSSPFHIPLDQAQSIGWLSLAPIVTAYVIKRAMDALN